MILAAPPSSTAATLHVDDFSAGGTSGWTGGTFGSGPPTRQPGGGPDGAGDPYLQVASTFTHLATYTNSAAWTGSYSAIGAAVVRVDMRNEVGSDPLDMRLVLFGPGNTAVRWNSTVAQSVPADGAWRTYEFSLAETDLMLVQGSAAYADLMNGVFRFMLRHNPVPSPNGVSVTATLGLDNIELAAAPPPNPADFNGDSAVDAVDLAAWEQAFGVSDGGDANGDGASTGADLLIWQRAFAPAPPAASVPEPGSLVLSVLAAFLSGYAASRAVERMTEPTDEPQHGAVSAEPTSRRLRRGRPRCPAYRRPRVRVSRVS